MSYKIEAGRVVFDEAPPEGAEVEIVVSTTNNLVGFKDPNNFYPRRVNEADTNRLAVNDLTNQHPVIKHKRDTVDDLTTEPKPSYNASYPFNHVKETESGHIQEFDDTPGHERIHEYHRSGTFYEVHPDGTRVSKIVGDGYEIVHGKKEVRVRGNVNVFVDGDASLYVRGNMDAQVDENLKFNVGKNIDFHAGENIRMFSNQSMEFTTQTTMTQTSVGKFLQQSVDDMQIVTSANFTNSVLGNYDMVIDGNSLTDIAGTMGTNVTSDVTFNSEGTFTSTITGATALSTEGTYTLASTGAMIYDTAATLNIGSGGAMNLDGSTVDLNTNGRSAVTITPVVPIVPRVTPTPAGIGIAPAPTFHDSGDIANGIKKWSISIDEYDTDGFVTTIKAPKSAEILDPLAFVPLADADEFYASDDEEKSEDELKAAVTSGEIKPTSFSDYSYNALTGKINTSGASRRVLSQPRIPDEGIEHGDPLNGNYSTSPTSSTASPSAETTPTTNYDDAGDYNGSVNYKLPLSKHYNLGQLSKHSIVAKSAIPKGGNMGKKQQEIIDNLKTLAVNVLDPIKEQYPNVMVTNAFRNRSGGSQHNTGNAADLQFSGVSKKEYYDIAIWISENIPHDQMLLEYKNTGSGNPWIHISLKESGNRAQVMTFHNHRRYGEVGNFYNLA